MVGDPKQLHPTVISREACKLRYSQSLFTRIYNRNNGALELISMLNTQFRMHLEISRFPSRAFYEGCLRCGRILAVIKRTPWHVTKAMGPFVFFDVKVQHESGVECSLLNQIEA